MKWQTMLQRPCGKDEFGQLLEVGVLAGSEGRPSDLEQWVIVYNITSFNFIIWKFICNPCSSAAGDLCRMSWILWMGLTPSANSIYSRVIVTVIYPNGSSVAMKISFWFSIPNCSRLKRMWCLLGITRLISAASGWCFSASSPMAYRVCCTERLLCSAKVFKRVSLICEYSVVKSIVCAVYLQLAWHLVASIRSSVSFSVVNLSLVYFSNAESVVFNIRSSLMP